MGVYRVIDVIGTSTQSWEDVAATAVKTARDAPRPEGRRGGGAGSSHRRRGR
jgi:Dodecin